MPTNRSALFLLTLLISLCSCTNNKEKRKIIVAEKIESITNHKDDWARLNARILNDEYVNNHLGKFIQSVNLNKVLADELKQKEISVISVYNNPSCQEIEYITTWTEYPIGTLYLTWTTCDSTQTKKGYYKDNFDSNFIEVWAAGHNWLIWIDSDFI